jgi:hypothetical protein
MEAKWLGLLRLYLRRLDARIEVLDNAYIPSLERLHDRHIMGMVRQSNQFTPKDIRLINYCQLYLQVVTLSDITILKMNKLYRLLSVRSISCKKVIVPSPGSFY